MFTIIANHRAKHQLDHQKALADGLKARGIGSVLSGSESHVETDLVACWGWRVGKRLRDRGHNVLVMERGYIGDRFAYTSLGWNGLNGFARFPEYALDRTRFDRLNITVKPWKKWGDYALILGQVPQDASLRGRDLVPWYSDIARDIITEYQIPVSFRPHPDLAKKGLSQDIKNADVSRGTLDEALEKAAFSICFNSNSSVDSVIAGVPCIVADRGSMAYEVCSTDLDRLYRPDRTEWLYRLAYKQWTIDEIQSGYPIKSLMDMI